MVKSLLLEILPFSHAPLGFRVSCLPHFAASQQLHPLLQPALNYIKVYVNLRRCHTLFFFAPFYLVLFSLECHFSPSFFCFPVDLFWHFQKGFVITSSVLVWHFVSLSDVTRIKLMITYLFTYMPPLIDCGLGSGLGLCFIYSVASKPRNTVGIL